MKWVLGFLIMMVSLSAYALRCGTDVVTEGMSRTKVQKLCGKPTSVVQITEQVKTKNGKESKKGQKLVQWVYNFGPTEFLYLVIFKKGTVSRIETDGYGYVER